MPSTPSSLLLQRATWTSLDVHRRSIADISIFIPPAAKDDPQECLVWQFRLHEYDINFQLLENGSVVQDLGRLKAAEKIKVDDNLSSSSLLLPLEAQTPTMEGRFDGIKPERVYTLRWDNTYSFIRQKQVQYRFLVISKRAVAAAELAIQETQSKGLSLSHIVATERAMTNKEKKVEKERLRSTLEQAVMDIVSIFTAHPDNPLHEGAIRPFILSLEAILCDGIKGEFLDRWPEAPFYEFLLETQHVLRDDKGIVTEVQAGKPPSNLQFLGWNHSRSFLMQALNKGILQRAFENLSKRRNVVEKYYKPEAFLFTYDNARRIAALLSALNGVTFLLADFPSEERVINAQNAFPQNLKQCTAEAPLLGNDIVFQDGVEGDSTVAKGVKGDPEEVNSIEDCSVPRFSLHERPFQDISVAPASFELIKLSSPGTILLVQLRVQIRDIFVTFTTAAGHDLTKPFCITASDELVELIVRFQSPRVDSLAVKLDNSYSLLRSKQVHIRCESVDPSAYKTAWKGCLGMARSISWNHASRDGSERCARYMVSLHQKDETEAALQRQKDGALTDEASQGKDSSMMGFPSSFLSIPVSYFVGGRLSSEDDAEACTQCLTPFTFFSRQHACLSCKKVVCFECSRHHAKIGGKEPPSRVCDRCFIQEKEKEGFKRTRIATVNDKPAADAGESPEYAALQLDPAMHKYFKMLSFGVPPSGVAQKMAQDEMPREKVAIFLARSDGSSSVCAGKGDKYFTDRSKLNRRDTTFRKVYWTSLESNDVNETIWARVTARRKAAPIALSSQDLKELEHLFGVRKTKVSRSGSKENTTKKTKFSALDSRRAKNISIGLSQFKPFGGVDAILVALKACDFEFLTVDRLTSLLQIAPNIVELKRYSNFRASRSRLEPPELFLVKMCEIPQVTEKIKMMLFVLQFQDHEQELRKRVHAITQACYEVLQSERLARCFELVLTIGNFLNTGTELEGAHGVTLASLLKLSETKTIDQSMSLLQFIVKLIHDRGEDDVLLFINDLCTLAEARRFSSVNCDSQIRALRNDIHKYELQIQENIEEDLKQFNKVETLGKLQVQRNKHQKHQLTLLSSSKTERNDVANSAPAGNSGTRTAVLLAIRQHGLNNMADAAKNTKTSPQSGLLAAIRSCRENVDVNADSAAQNMLHSRVKSKSRSIVENIDSDQRESKQSKGEHTCRKVSSCGAASEQNEAHADKDATCLAERDSIQQFQTEILANSATKAEPSESRTMNSGPQAALLAAIRQQSGKLKRDKSIDHTDACSTNDVNFEPRPYQTRSKFILIMKERLLSIKTAFEEMEMEWETLRSVWGCTARYLAEDSCESSSEYVFGLLHKFVLDVKVANALLYRKGLSFTTKAHTLLPHAHVGSIVATKFGSGVITALRAAEKRIEVKFPWSQEAFLAPSAILSVGSLVRCRHWGVGIIRKTCYDVGFCEIRFSFGYGKLRVEDLTLEASSNQAHLRRNILNGGFFHGDPVLTPFGYGHVQSIRGSPQSSAAVLAVSLFGSDSSNDLGVDLTAMALAFVPAHNVKHNF